MTDNKRFVHIEHKGADYILDNPNWDLDYIEMLGDTLEEKEIVDLLNELNDENEQLRQELSQFRNISKDYNIPFDKLTDAFEDSISENEQLKSENEDLKTYKEAVSDILISWSQKNLTAKQLSIVIAIMEELDVEVDKK